MNNNDIIFTVVPDERFSPRQILIGNAQGKTFYASFVSRRDKAENAIREAAAVKIINIDFADSMDE